MNRDIYHLIDGELILSRVCRAPLYPHGSLGLEKGAEHLSAQLSSSESSDVEVSKKRGVIVDAPLSIWGDR